ncbi:cobalamin biosynthesis protein [Paraburkholderia sp. GAS348]|uniref:cobalamin biosynthesis protein n=1 Tax=Paraburkholderia sp. GAS348 TaxID=3035132 RepID=UPI003D1F71DE
MKTLSIGIGCRLHSSAEQIEAAVRAALGSHAFDEISAIASVDTKAHETGLLEFCARHALPLKLFSRAQIAAISVSDPSAATREHLGIDGVCEPCALLAAAAESDAGSAPRAAYASALASVASGASGTSVASVASAAAVASTVPAASVASITPDPPNARLLVRKTIHGGVTVAIASITAQPAREQTNNTHQEQDLS